METISTSRAGRPRSIDRDALLDAAETIVIERGAAALTIDAVAKAMNITKGGVQYAFGTKDALVQAMLDRWNKSYDDEFAQIAGSTKPDPIGAIRIHAETTFLSDESGQAKSASLLTALLQSPEGLASMREWYAQWFKDLDLEAEEGRKARLAFMAIEGAFMLRYFGLLDIDGRQWQQMLDEVKTLVP